MVYCSACVDAINLPILLLNTYETLTYYILFLLLFILGFNNGYYKIYMLSIWITFLLKYIGDISN